MKGTLANLSLNLSELSKACRTTNDDGLKRSTVVNRHGASKIADYTNRGKLECFKILAD
jgi:hypothetical protein